MQLLATAAVVMVAALHHSNSAMGATDTGAPHWQRLSRRSSVRAALANKMDPNFWPTRGRRADPTSAKHPLLSLEQARRQTADETGPFWANRGRSAPEMEALASDPAGPFWANRGRSTDELDGSKETRQGDPPEPFWANRGRSAKDWGALLANRQNEVEGPFWGNRGRAVDGTGDDDGPFWGNRGRSTSSEEDPFWANRGRSANLEGTSEEDDPFWANRGRSLDEGHKLASIEGQHRDMLFAEEPGWVSLPRHGGRRSAIAPSDHQADQFWVSRGKKDIRSKRNLPLEFADAYWQQRSRRGSKTNRALEQLKDAQFWPSRGKKGSSPSELLNEQIWQLGQELAHKQRNKAKQQNQNLTQNHIEPSGPPPESTSQSHCRPKAP